MLLDMIKNYETIPDTEATEEYLKTDQEFLADAQDFLIGRANEVVYSPDEIMERFLSHMRSGSINEATMIGDLEYAQDTDDTSKVRFGRLLDTFERMDTSDGFASKAWDYGWAGVTAPSTLAGAVAGFIGRGKGVGEVAKQKAVGQAARTGLKAILSDATKKAGAQTVKAGAIRGSVIEAPIGAIGEDIYQRTREETGLGRQAGAVAVAGVASGVLGGAVGAAAGYFGKQMGKRADELTEAAQRSVQKKRFKQTTVNRAVTEKLMQIDPDLVAHGRKVLSDLNKNEKLTAYLDAETLESISVAATRIASKLERKPGERVTTTVVKAMAEGKIATQEIKDVMDEHGITITDFVSAYATTASDAGRTLGKLGNVMKAMRNHGFIDEGDADVVAAFDKPSRLVTLFSGLDRLRLGNMTAQLVTTARNTIGGGFRMVTDALDTSFASYADAAIGKKTYAEATKDVFSTTRFFMDQKTGQVVKELFESGLPSESRKLFFSAAQAEARHGGTGVLSKVANGINIANTISDNIFKRAIFSSTLDRQLREKTGKSLVQTIKDGEFNTIDKDTFKIAIDESLYFTYQNRPSYDSYAGKLGNAIINLHRDVPFTVSVFIPFPRFVSSQLKFLTEHAPIPGLPFLTQGLQGKLPSKKQLAQNATGMVLLGSSVAWRAQQDPSTSFYEHYNEKDQVVNTLALMGPMAGYMLMGDLIVRAYKGDPIDSVGQYAKEMVEALGAPRFQGAFGLPILNDIWDDFKDGKFDRAMGKMVGDLLGTYTIPAATIRDFASVYNPDARFVEDLNRIIVGDGDNQYVNWFEYSVLYAGKYLPFYNEEAGLTYSVPEENRRYSSTAGALKKRDPAGKQFTGMTTYSPKTDFEREADRLQIERYEFFGRDKDPMRNALNQKFLGERLPDTMISYITSPDYLNKNDLERRDALVKEVRRIAEEYQLKEVVDGVMSDIVTNKPYEYTHMHREAYEELNRTEKKLLESYWKEDKQYNGLSIYEAGAFVWAIKTHKNRLENANPQ